MADKMMSERLQPSLLDRLTDDEPTIQTENRDARVIDIRRLRDIIQRDLGWLLNTTNNDSWIDAAKTPLVAKSVLNYGVHDATGNFSGKDKALAIRKTIIACIETYEPRIRKGSIQVDMRSADASRSTVINFDIRADMWAEPIPIELYLRSTVDVTTGQLSLDRSG